MSADATLLATATLASVAFRPLTSIPFRRRTEAVGAPVEADTPAVGADGRLSRPGRTVGGGG